VAEPNQEQGTSQEQQAAPHDEARCTCPCHIHHPCKTFCQCFREYARERPEAAMMWAFLLGFLVGWKLKPR
jgi:hypothetical protein